MLKIANLQIYARSSCMNIRHKWRTDGGEGVWVVQTPRTPEIPKALQNRTKLNPIVEKC